MKLLAIPYSFKSRPPQFYPMAKEKITITQDRKKQHLDITLNKDITYRKTTGFENIEFIHNALPEADFGKIDTSVNFLGRTLSFPFFIDSMTGGHSKTESINEKLAKVASENKVAFALGSIRAMIENPKLKETFAVREFAKDIPIIANIGAAQLTQIPHEKIISAMESLEADAIQVHLNPLQEVLQPEGDKNFEGVEKSISDFCRSCKFPVIAKETGAGISGEVALRLKRAGVKMLNVSGSGGTSWAKVEYERGAIIPGFEEWGIPTAIATASCSKILPTISSGGIRSGIDVAKSISLGAICASSALSVLRAENPGRLIQLYKTQFKTAMFLTGSRNVRELTRAKILITGKARETMRAMGLIS